MKKCFKDFVSLKRGFDLPEKKRVRGKIPVYSANGISGYHNTPSCPAPGVITGRSGTIGSVMYSQTPFWALNTTLFVEDFKGNIPRFVYYFLSNFDLSRFSTGAVVPTLNRNDFSDISIDVPEKAEQLRIAGIHELNLNFLRPSAIFLSSSFP